jgi:hypothetical protein
MCLKKTFSRRQNAKQDHFIFEVFSQKKIGDFDPKYCYVMAKIDQGF